LSEAAHLVYQTEKLLSRSFFDSFQTLFDRAAPLGSSLISILPPPTFVNRFLQKSLIFFACRFPYFFRCTNKASALFFYVKTERLLMQYNL
ncbi:hypothetical protein, partial [Agathobaculum sp. Marseille-P7918]|uniref:hypothetical protein n=1 Tax=Agathobaculum sp. Marseille-P7918 TaxID=2479843 RepID=UPI0019CFAC32